MHSARIDDGLKLSCGVPNNQSNCAFRVPIDGCLLSRFARGILEQKLGQGLGQDCRGFGLLSSFGCSPTDLRWLRRFAFQGSGVDDGSMPNDSAVTARWLSRFVEAAPQCRLEADVPRPTRDGLAGGENSTPPTQLDLRAWTEMRSWTSSSSSFSSSSSMWPSCSRTRRTTRTRTNRRSGISVPALKGAISLSEERSFLHGFEASLALLANKDN